MKAYRATGTFRAGKKDQPYTLDVVALDEEAATEQVYSNFGSRHRVKRRFVIIDSLSEINPSDSLEPKVISHFRD
ncbi:MAG: 50S ribosomal protein L18a [Euryarchaeota archaeon]|jgi:large subunit ribosomal protein LX|nr:50S ribosomal protein L18a [Euryarchaeota archaeon]|tara:strand:+ start:5883 stop:6107 length:225 start_codon:yes stop_codon:yes gene_type:complete